MPEGIVLDKLTGEIKGKCKKSYKEQKYTITCRNEANEMKYYLTLEIGEMTKFSYLRNDIISYLNDDIYYFPVHDGGECEFTIDPGINNDFNSIINRITRRNRI